MSKELSTAVELAKLQAKRTNVAYPTSGPSRSTVYADHGSLVLPSDNLLHAQVHRLRRYAGCLARDVARDTASTTVYTDWYICATSDRIRGLLPKPGFPHG